MNKNFLYEIQLLLQSKEKMEESDDLLITTLKQFVALPNQISTLQDIKAQQVFTISLKVLEYLKQDVTEIRALSMKSQKFRSMAKLNQALYAELQAGFQLNQLMNPSIPFLRKYLLVIINKLSSLQSNQRKNKSKAQINSQKQSKQTVELKNWLNQQWIHPSLLSKKPKYKGYILPMTVTKNLLKNNLNIIPELNNPHLNGNVPSIIAGSISRHNYRVKQFEANEGISRKQGEQALVKFQNILKANKDEWNISSNKLQKIKKKAIEDNQASSVILQPQSQESVFKQELQQAQRQAFQRQAEKKKIIQQMSLHAQQKEQQNLNIPPQEIATLNPLQLLKQQAQRKRQQYQNQIKSILALLKQRKQQIQTWESQKVSLENQIVNDQEGIVKIKQETVDLKKQVEKRQTILSTLEGQKDIESEVNKLEGEIKDIEDQVKEEVDKIEKETNQMQAESKMKMDALTDLKMKLNKIENDYENICQEIVEKEQLKGGVKIMKSGISRLYYHKKISQIEHRWKETQKQTKKIRNNLVQLRQKTRLSSTFNIRLQTELQNLFNLQKARSEPQTRVLKQLLTKCKESFNKTYSILEEVNSVKMQTQEYQMKVHTLSGKNYKQNIGKISLAMEELKKQIEGSKMKNK